MNTAQIVAELIKAVADLVIEAFREGDPRKLKRVLDVLPPSSKLRTEAVAELERQRMREALKQKGESV